MISWDPSITNTDGSPLLDLAGYVGVEALLSLSWVWVEDDGSGNPGYIPQYTLSPWSVWVEEGPGVTSTPDTRPPPPLGSVLFLRMLAKDSAGTLSP